MNEVAVLKSPLASARQEVGEFLKVREVAELLRVPESTVYRLISSGDLPSLRLKRTIRVPKNAVMQLIEGGGIPSE